MNKSRANQADHGTLSMIGMQDRERFVALWRRCLMDAPVLAEALYAELDHLYGEPSRRYHTLAHIRHCLDEFDQASTFMDNADAVEMALWFHDAIYIPGATDNERCSAELFRQRAGEDAAPAFCQLVHELIMATTHRVLPQHKDEQFIVDIDLSSFGLGWEDFLRDSRLIREELGNLTDADFYPAQLRFLLTLRGRPHFFFTDFFRERYERIARDNIRRIIEELRALGHATE
ncbi:MAG: hypothetical protein U1F42_08985 [Candidatus Competibacteraceae bacterium]